MAVHLREPFFLRGRTSVLQRAVIMSCALGGLTAAAAWLLACTSIVAEVFIRPHLAQFLGESVLPIVAALVCGAIVASAIYAPLNY